MYIARIGSSLFYDFQFNEYNLNRIVRFHLYADYNVDFAGVSTSITTTYAEVSLVRAPHNKFYTKFRSILAKISK